MTDATVTSPTKGYTDMSPRVIPETPNTARQIPPACAIRSERLAEEATIDETNLGMVLDVELNVMLRFGERQLSLREVLDLKCGSVIELDRRVDEPVELLLDGRVIARGEAAIVDGNYGLRVTEILQPAVSARTTD